MGLEQMSTKECCSRCFGRGYQPEVRKTGKGLYLRTCPGCGGAGEREPPRRKHKVPELKENER